MVTVADDGTVTSVGGAAMAMISAEGYKSLYRSRIVDTGELATGYDTITPGTYRIEPGRNMDVDDANFTCPVGSVRCDVTVSDDGIVTSVGGTATAKNSVAVMTTMTAQALYAVLILSIPAADSPMFPVATNVMTEIDSTVASSTTGKVTITLDHGPDDTIDYASKAVDSGYEIDGWDSQTLTRDSGTTRKPKLEEATVYTNIEPATAKKLKIDLGDVGGLTSPRFVLDSGQGPESKLVTAMEFTGKFGSIPGTFTCDGATAR